MKINRVISVLKADDALAKKKKKQYLFVITFRKTDNLYDDSDKNMDKWVISVDGDHVY